MSRTESHSNHPTGVSQHNVSGGLEEYERETEGRLPFYLTTREVKLLGIAGVSPRLSLYLSHDHTHPLNFFRLVSSSMVSLI